jgi:diguanylate cyclase (GGDEF)-like protein/PAS domain S-box-containing protein
VSELHVKATGEGEGDRPLRRQNAVLVELARTAVVHSGELDEALRTIAERTAETLGAERVGVWFFTPDRQSIRCVESYERSSRFHSSGDVLTEASNPAYFKALEAERVINAGDARSDPRTRSFLHSYLAPFGVTSMLDAPIRRLGTMTGIICIEHTGPARQWSADDENFASSVADLVVTALDAAERRQTQEALRRRLEFEKIVANVSTRFAGVADEDLDDAICQALGEIGTFIEAERCHTILLSDDGLSGRMLHEWSASGDDLRGERYGDLPTAAFPWWIERMQRFENVSYTSVDELPAVAVNERRLFERQQIRSVLFVPMKVKGRLIGSVGASTLTHERRWSDEVVGLLRLVGEIFAGAIERSRAHRALLASEQRHRLLFERNLAGVYQNRLDGRMLDCNEAMAAMLGYDSREEFLKLNARDLYFDPHERDAFTTAVLAGNGIRGVEVCLRRRDGRPVWLLESVHLLTNTGEAPVLEGTVIDITDRKLAETALRESEERYRFMAENSNDIISRTNASGVITYASDAVRTLTGYEAHEVIGHTISEFVVEEDRHLIERMEKEILLESAPRTFTFRLRRKDGTGVWIETTVRAVRDASGGRVQEVVSVSRDVSERRRAEEQIEYQAYHDALTLLPNRLLFRDRLTIALAHARRQQTALAVMFLDLDRFKDVNDTLGHSLGDELLRAVAGILQRAVRDGDTIARMGGDEFTILLDDIGSAEDAAKTAQKLLDALRAPVPVGGHELFVTASIGIALYPEDGDSAELLLKNADTAMYRAKESGRNSYRLCTRAMNNRAAERLSVENALRRALDRNELVLHYQPLVTLENGRVAGMEALLRWKRPEHGMVQPATFIGIAEDTRMIVPIGEWVLREACRQAKAWQADDPHRRISVNLSPRQFQQGDLCAVVAGALESSGLSPACLELEITESTAMLNTERTLAMLAALRELGVTIAIDDFGTGHSSLSYLRRFAIDRVKIDREFIQEIEASRSNRAIISGIIALARGLGVAVTAEGVETEQQADFLRAQSCDEVQGYYFGRPAAI